MYIVHIEKLFGIIHEYKFPDPKECCDFLIKVMNDGGIRYDIYYFEDGMREPFNLRVRASTLKINDFNRKMLRKKRDFEIELLKRAEQEAANNKPATIETKENSNAN